MKNFGMAERNIGTGRRVWLHGSVIITFPSARAFAFNAAP